MVLALVAIILTLVLVIGMHEAGHALAAWFFNIKIKRIAIGFGRPLLRWQSRLGYEWVLGMWLLGGYVQLNNTRISPVTPEEYPSCFDKKPIWQRIIVLSAGAFANLLTAWLAFTLVFWLGMDYRTPQIKTVAANSLAAKAGLMAQDQWLTVAGHATDSWEEVGLRLIISWGKNIPITVKNSKGQIKQSHLDLSQAQFSSHSLLSSIGVSSDKSAAKQKTKAASLFAAMRNSGEQVIDLTVIFLLIVKQILVGIIPLNVLLGPIGLLATSVTSLTQGIIVFSCFIATLSVAVALLNLFPIPSLDGGSIVYAVLEKIRGRPISVAVELLIYRLMLVGLFLLLVQLLKNDLAVFIVQHGLN